VRGKYRSVSPAVITISEPSEEARTGFVAKNPDGHALKIVGTSSLAAGGSR
jgi:hypothetical protein